MDEIKSELTLSEKRFLRILLALTLLALSAFVSNALAEKAMESFGVESWVSSEFHPMHERWYSDPWPEEMIPNRLSQQALVAAKSGNETAGTVINIDPDTRYQSMLGFGVSLEHTTVYAIRKNKSIEEQKEMLRDMIDPENGMGLNMFRITIGTSDFADGTRATPVPEDPDGWYSYRDNHSDSFSIERDHSLGIIETIKLAMQVAEESGTELKFVASPWSPPKWMKTSNDLVGGSLIPGMESELANYLRNFVEAYEREGIPIYALTLQNEHYFSPPAYPGMLLTWQQERDLLIETYENFHNISGDFGRELNTKLWLHDHNFNDWWRVTQLLTSLKKMGKYHYADATAFHHYEGKPSAMELLHSDHPEKDIVFSEGSLWGLSADDNSRSFETLIRHLRNWSRGYLGWVTATTQQLDEANKGPYNTLGIFSPTLLVQKGGDSRDWYRTPEYWLMSQFSRFIKPGAERIGSDYGSLDTVTSIAFVNPDDSIIVIAANQGEEAKSFSMHFKGYEIPAQIPPRSIATYRWKNK